MQDNFDVTVPEIPLPEEKVDASIRDEFKSGFRFCFIGSGQAGGRIASSFWQLGYRRVCVINSAEQDLAGLSVPEKNRFCIGSGGSGKNPSAAKQLIKNQTEDMLDLMRRSFGLEFDRIFVTAGLGGGTGSGTAATLAETASNLQQQLNCKSAKVGAIVSLPKNSEGKKVNANAYSALKDMLALVKKGIVSPLIILDNEKINVLYPSLAVAPFWNTANLTICSIFHLFNTITECESPYSTFDQSDFSTVLDSGLIIFGAAPLKSWSDATDISYAVRRNLQGNLLSGGFDLAKGKVAGTVIIGSADVLEKVPQTFLDHAFDQLTRMLGAGSTVHRGIYRGNKEGMTVYTCIGGLEPPTERIADLKKYGEIVEEIKPEPWPE